MLYGRTATRVEQEQRVQCVVDNGEPTGEIRHAGGFEPLERPELKDLAREIVRQNRRG